MIIDQAITFEYRKLKVAGKSKNEIKKAFRKKVPMIFLKGEKDTIISQ